MALCVAACSGGVLSALPAVAVDLVAELEFARRSGETPELDLGTERARAHLMEGWSHDETREVDGGTFVWSDGERSSLWLDLVEARDRALVLTGAPFATARTASMEVGVAVNGADVATVRIGPGYTSRRVAIERDHWRRGRNVVTFFYGRTYRPADIDPAIEDERDLAVQWDSVRLEGACEGASPSAESSGESPRLLLPACSRVAYHMRVPPGAMLDLSAIRSIGGRGSLAVEVADEHRHSRAVRIDAPPGGGRAWTWPLELTGVVRLALSASDVGVEIVAPTVRFDPPDPARATSLEAVVPHRPANVLLYVMDTVRADHLGVYGYERDTTPAIDAFAREATVFDRAVAQSSWTRPTMASVLTGLEPATHGVRRRNDALPEEAVTLAERLRDAGYATAGFVANLNLKAAFGFGQGFETYRYLRPPTYPEPLHVDARRLNAPALRWLRSRDRERPYFLFVHSMEPHDPYDPAPAFERRFVPETLAARVGSVEHMDRLSRGLEEADDAVLAGLIGRYDAEIAANDDAFRELIEGMYEIGALQNTLVILASDHGEEFLDHDGWRHGETLYEEQIRAVLVLRFPDGVAAGERSDALVQQIDVVPTALAAAGVTIPATLPGRNLREVALGQDPGWSMAFPTLRLGGRDLDAVVTPKVKWVGQRSSGSAELFDLTVDPQELDDLSGTRPVLAGYLDQEMRRAEARRPDDLAGATAELDADDVEQLRLLGYLD